MYKEPTRLAADTANKLSFFHSWLAQHSDHSWSIIARDILSVPQLSQYIVTGLQKVALSQANYIIQWSVCTRNLLDNKH